MICLGCCIDHQSVARSRDFDDHAYRDLYDALAAMTSDSVTTLRRICLNHQEEIIRSESAKETASAEFVQLQTQVAAAKRDIDPE